jgi:TonB family protein
VSPPLIAILGVTGFCALLFLWLSYSGKFLDKFEAIKARDPKRAARIWGTLVIIIMGLRGVVAYLHYVEYRDEHPRPQAISQSNVRLLDVPKLIKSVEPVYPRLAREARVQGTVRLRAVIDASGKVQEVKLIEGPPMLVQAAIDAARQFEYSPPTADGRPINVRADLVFTFQLNSSGARLAP